VKRFSLVLFAFVVSALAMQATSMPAATVGGSGGIDGLPATPLELGFRFTPTINISVTALGTWDVSAGAIPSGTGVGLFSSGGSLLASVSYPGTTTYSGSFRYVDLTTPVTLFAGSAYTVLSYIPGSTNAPLDLLAPVTFNSDLSQVHFTNSYLNPGSGLTFLGTVPGGLSDYSQFGPNFQFAAAPEPSSGGLLAFGLVGLLLAYRMFRKAELLQVLE